jgi:hypothetical protein
MTNSEVICWAVVIQGIVCAGFCGFVAGEKNRDSFGWMVLGLFFGTIALLALIGVPTIKVQSNVANAVSNGPGILDDGRWRCRCSYINSKTSTLCYKCKRSPNAIN